MAIKLDPTWLAELKDEFDKEYFKDLKSFLLTTKQSGISVYPPSNQIFAALDACTLPNLKVVIIGQDPYHGVGQANGLCFSVNKGIPVPPSLQNIYKELQSDLQINAPSHGDLTSWAKQGVLLLNATLTVSANQAGSHQNKGWEKFTDRVIEVINTNKSNVVFMLWGGYAKKKGKSIDEAKHLVLRSGHPSPLSANRGYWFGSKHFSQCNDYLTKQGSSPINWEDL